MLWLRNCDFLFRYFPLTALNRKLICLIKKQSMSSESSLAAELFCKRPSLMLSIVDLYSWRDRRRLGSLDKQPGSARPPIGLNYLPKLTGFLDSLFI